MKTPEEIKKGLEIAVNGCTTCDCCITDCPYDLECHPMGDTNADLPKQMASDALAYIQQLENHIGELTEKVSQFEAAHPKWISVKDRLPEDNLNVLVYAIGDNENSVIAMTGYTHKMYGYNIEGWRSPWQYFFYEYKITHWMPLPEPPKEDCNE